MVFQLFGVFGVLDPLSSHTLQLYLLDFVLLWLSISCAHIKREREREFCAFRFCLFHVSVQLNHAYVQCRPVDGRGFLVPGAVHRAIAAL
jgi:hypothetical protein